jgi:hypothetical protein
MSPRRCHGDSETRPRTRTRPGTGRTPLTGAPGPGSASGPIRHPATDLPSARPGPAKIGQLSPVVNIDGNGAVASAAVAAQRRRGGGLSCVSLLRFQCRCTDIQRGRQGRRPMSSECERTGPSIRARRSSARAAGAAGRTMLQTESCTRTSRGWRVLRARHSRIPNDHVLSPRDGAWAVPAQRLAGRDWASPGGRAYTREAAVSYADT